jgi:anti-sigma-K factor RskA
MNAHITREEDFDLYALGAFEADENRAIESHLAACADCARKLAEAQGRIAALGLSAPLVPPSPQVRERLLRQLREATPAYPEKPAVGVSNGPRDPERPAAFAVRAWTWLLAPAVAALAVTTIFLWIENGRLARQMADLRTLAQQQQKQLDETRNVAHLFESRDTVTVPLESMPGLPRGAVRVLYNSQMGMLMYDGWIDPPPSDKSYQLWVVPADGAPISVGVFNPATGDRAHWMTKVPAGVAAKAFAVTLEPAGGTSQPTGPKVFVGPVS